MAHQRSTKGIRAPKVTSMAQRISKRGVGPFTGRRLSYPRAKLALPSEAATRRTINRALGKRDK